MKKLIVVVPLYTSDLDAVEWLALDKMYSLLADRYPIAILCPVGMDCSEIVERFPSVEVRTMAAHNFVSIDSYNAMMLCSDVYDLFLDAKYMLIYQTDCYLFNDQIESFLDLDYDYIGAPWLPKPKYLKWYNRVWISIQRFIFSFGRGKKRLRHSLYYRVGNGGLCLRKIEAMRRVTSQKEIIAQWLNSEYDIKNEDVYFSLFEPSLSIAPFEVGLRFAFDTQPALAYRFNENKLPMGCHAWARENTWGFWRDHIGCGFEFEPKKVL